VPVPNVARNLDGGSGTWFVHEFGRRDYLIEEIVRGRTLPVTVITGVDELNLLGVADGRAILFAKAYTERYLVSVVDLHQASNYIERSASDDSAELPRTVLATDDDQRTPLRPGEVAASRFTVELLADGSAVVAVAPKDAQRRAYRVDAATVRGTAPWRLTTPATLGARNTIHGPDGAGYAPSEYDMGPTAVLRGGIDGRFTPAVGGVSDGRCTLARDPRSSNLADLDQPGAPGLSAVDRVGNLWLILGRDPGKGESDLYVVSSAGELSRMPTSWHGTSGLRIAGDGSLFVTARTGPHTLTTYHLGDPPAAARNATPLPPQRRVASVTTRSR
jgi:hypothetical protein